MPQSAVTVRLDTGMKMQFEELCEQFGMSANTAFNIFVRAVVRSRSIPFQITGEPAKPDVMDLFLQQRRKAETSEGPELTLEDINDEIRLARKERSAKKEVAV